MTNTTRLLVLVVVVCAVVVVVWAKVSTRSETAQNTRPEVALPEKKDLSEPDVTTARTNGAPEKGLADSDDLPVLLELHQEHCPACKEMKPILAELRKDYKGQLKVVEIDLSEQPEYAKKYNVYFIPVQVFLDKEGGEIVWQHEGFLSRSEIDAQLSQMDIKPAARDKN